MAQSQTASMARTSISVSEKLADELYDRKKRGESYEDVIWRLIEESEECPPRPTARTGTLCVPSTML
ncbi:hypothetical protein [Halalkalicoccus jeotgali]|uniref:Uncharacterized protein n=2 Tax=Halalkalicoccus jeotgali (strain DSM 18796 / CECT 7217 / JCM 14584 / KCTC 4019 / B3) TaxID=795797 RepID=L9W032_HALJB|nr:hypothetical protein [Halalkalicoccus jeotgali]ELY41668.1 hypothetical protein C497_00225 [Halalkalicoccus jeotgali B3]